MITVVSFYFIIWNADQYLVEFIFNGRYFWRFMCLALRDSLLLAIRLSQS